MPIYEYECTSCQHTFEELTRSMTEPRPRECPACGRRTAHRKLSLFAARQDTTTPAATSGPCGRCGDPDGPCAL